ncbi:LLM class flavin-dependent oxidoreductase, partial [Klebsiella sp. Kps]|nr:LLM class flavin-dependent oxidoreductase [Klebsiella sp. Kps]
SYYEDVKTRIRHAGRDSAAVGIMPGLVTYIGSTMDEARRKKAELDELLPTEQSLAMLSTFTGQDCAAWELDAPVPPLPPAAEFTGPQGRYET